MPVWRWPAERMRYFRVMLHGGGVFVGSHDKTVLKLKSETSNGPVTGFHTTRIVRAGDEADAVQKAIGATHDELQTLAFDKVNQGGAPDFCAEEVVELSCWQFLWAKPRRGFTFYSEPDDA
jgi:hypothetical protein